MTTSRPVVIVTGASRGIGRAIAFDLAQNGYTVWLVAREEARLDPVASAIRQAGGQAEQFGIDLTRIEHVPALINAVMTKSGRIDGLVNNAGMTRRGKLTEVTPEDYDAVMALNVRSLLFLTQGVLSSMHKGGAIVNVASLNAFDVIKGAGLYAASKAAVVQLTRGLAIDAAEQGVRVNAIAPGFIHTDFNAALWERREMRDWVETNTPLRRLGTPEDIVGSVRFLLGRDSAFITGEVLVVDGGFLPTRMWPL